MVTRTQVAKCFTKFMINFIKYSHASKENPTLLILDNHKSHVSVDVIQLAKDNGVIFHSPTSLQPLDITMYASFKSKYNAALNNWMLSNPGKTVTIYSIPALVSSSISSSLPRLTYSVASEIQESIPLIQIYLMMKISCVLQLLTKKNLNPQIFYN